MLCGSFSRITGLELMCAVIRVTPPFDLLLTCLVSVIVLAFSHTIECPFCIIGPGVGSVII